jgi:hypothetical protein
MDPRVILRSPDPPQVPSPALSAIVLAPFAFGDVGKLIRCLAQQTIRDRVEVVLVVPSAKVLGSEGEAALQACGAYQVLEVGPMKSLPAARAAGIRAARAPIVALTEDHCFPEPDWAAALVRAHDGPWVAVAPVFEAPIPRRSRARAACLVQYAPWTNVDAGCELDDLPGHNSSYKRHVLLAYGESLDRMLLIESVLHWDLRRRGHRLWLEPGARVRHVYMTKWWASTVENYYIARGFAAARARGWSVLHRAAFVLASPLVPVVRFSRLAPRALAFGWGRDIPNLSWLLLVSGVGELMGCAFGPGPSVTMGVELDTRRYRFISPEDRAAIWGDVPSAADRITSPRSASEV